MKILAFLLAIFICSGVSAENITSGDSREQREHSQRATYDVSQLQFSSLSIDAPLVLSKIDRASIELIGLDASHSISPVTYVTKRGRKFVFPRDKGVSITVGSFSSFTILHGQTEVLREYQWNTPTIRMYRRSRQSEDDQNYSPFYSGGTIIFGYNEKAEGAAKFRPVYLIPDEWANSVLPAFKFQQANKSLFDDKNVVKNQKRLLELTGDVNPFNAVAAARVLAPARGLDAKFVKEQLAQSTGYQQAIFTYLAFKNAHALQQESIDAALRQIVNNATSSAALKWITLGVTTAQNDNANSYFALKDRVKTILLRVDKKQKELKTKTPDDEYVNELLISAQVRERPAMPAAKTSNF